MHESTFRLLLFILSLIFYLVFGSLIFSLLERDGEEALRERLRTTRMEFLLNHDCVETDELEEFIEILVAHGNGGVTVFQNASNETNWYFGHSLFFTASLAATIGYGKVLPLTTSGKLFAVCFALLGIPWLMIVFSLAVESSTGITSSLLDFLHDRLALKRAWKSSLVRLLHFTLIFLAVLAVGFVVPALIFWRLEKDWSFLDAFYFCFMTSTTLGLGHHVPGESTEHPMKSIYKGCVAIYFFFGAISVMLLLAVGFGLAEGGVAFYFRLPRDCDSKSDKKKLIFAVSKKELLRSQQIPNN